MRILVGMAHPKHVYMFKNFIKEMETRGHVIRILMIEKEITKYLLQQADLPYIQIGKNPPKLHNKILSIPMWEYLTFKIAREFKPDIFIGQALPHFAHISAILGKPYIIFEDTESATVVQKICFPFADAIVTPSCYKADLGDKQSRFDGYYELAYLHPDYFKPNPAILRVLGLNKADVFIVIRLVSWNAIHDIGHKGFDLELLIKLVKQLGKHGKVFITSEKPLPTELEKYKISGLAKENIHDLLYYASMYIGESPTMTTESAVLGTPALCVSSWACSCGNFEDLSKNYGLVYCSSDQNYIANLAIKLLKQTSIKNEWQNRRKKLLINKINVTRFMIDFIENYSVEIEAGVKI